MMRLLLASILFLALTITASANTGKTADGCTYRIINGQYLTSCEGKDQVANVAAAAEATPVVLSYGAVPMRNNAPTPRPVVTTLAIEPPSQNQMFEDAYDAKRRRERDQFLDSTFVGLLLGSTSLKNADSSLGMGVSLGTSIDDHFGVELSYTYTKQELRLGLGEGGLSPYGGFGAAPALTTDSSLTSHLITGEFQGFLTDPFKRLRPYLGLGLGWKSSTLKELTRNYGGGYGMQTSGAALSQSTLGGIGTAGTKLRLAKSFHLGFAFRYFFPLARQTSRLEVGNAYGSGAITQADEPLTGSGQTQLLGGVQYSF